MFIRVFDTTQLFLLIRFLNGNVCKCFLPILPTLLSVMLFIHRNFFLLTPTFYGISALACLSTYAYLMFLLLMSIFRLCTLFSVFVKNTGFSRYTLESYFSFSLTFYAFAGFRNIHLLQVFRSFSTSFLLMRKFLYYSTCYQVMATCFSLLQMISARFFNFFKPFLKFWRFSLLFSLMHIYSGVIFVGWLFLCVCAHFYAWVSSDFLQIRMFFYVSELDTRAF